MKVYCKPNTMPRLRRVSSIRRMKRNSRKLSSNKKNRYRSTSAKSVPPAFAAFNKAKEGAEYRGDTMFEHNGKHYTRHAWNNGISVWRRV